METINKKKFKKKNLGYFRAYDYSENANPIELCKHIEIVGKLMKDDEGCEYITPMKVFCKLCKTEFKLDECIN